MFEGLISDVLVKILGQYVEGISSDTISFGVWNGTLELRSLRIRSEALSMLLLSIFGKDSPFLVRSGVVDSIIVNVPWKYLRSQPVKIKLQGLRADVTINSKVDSAAMHRKAEKLKKIRLAADDAYRAVAYNSGGSGEQNSSTWASWLRVDDLTSSVLQNIQIELDDVSLKIHGSDSSFLFGLEGVQIVSTDASWQERFLPTTGLPFSYKIARVTNLKISHIDRKSESSHGNERNILVPLSFTTKLTMLKGGEATGVPSVLLQIEFPHVGFSLSDQQYKDVMRMSMEVASFGKKIRLADRSPGAAYWAIALEQLSPGIQQRYRDARALDAHSLRRRLAMIKSYINARKKLLDAQISGKTLEPQVMKLLDDYESKLSTEEILLFRDLAARENNSKTIEVKGRYGEINTRIQFRLREGLFNINLQQNFSNVQPLAKIEFQQLCLSIDTYADEKFDLCLTLHHLEMRGGKGMKSLIFRRDDIAPGKGLDLAENENWGETVTSELQRLREKRKGNEKKTLDSLALMRVVRTVAEVRVFAEIAGLDVSADGSKGALMTFVQFWSPPDQSSELLGDIEQSALANLEYVREQFTDSFFVRRTAVELDVSLQAPRLLIYQKEDSRHTPFFELDLGQLQLKTIHSSAQHLEHDMNLTNLSISWKDGEEDGELILPPTSFNLSLKLPADKDEQIEIRGLLPNVWLNISSKMIRQAKEFTRVWLTKRKQAASTSSQMPSSLISDAPVLKDEKEEQPVVYLLANFRLQKGGVKLLDSNGGSQIEVASGGISVGLEKAHGQISGSFAMNEITVAYTDLVADETTSLMKAGVDESLTAQNPLLRGEDDGHFFRAGFKLGLDSGDCTSDVDAQSLHLLVDPKLLEKILEQFRKSSDEVELSISNNFTSRKSFSRFSNEAMKLAEPALGANSFSLVMQCKFSSLRITACLPDGAAFACFDATQFVMNNKYKRTTGLTSTASLRSFYVRDLRAVHTKLQDMIYYKGSEDSVLENFLRVDYKEAFAVEMHIIRPKVTLLSAFARQLLYFPSSVLQAVGIYSGNAEQTTPSETGATSSFQFKVILQEVSTILPRSSSCPHEGISLINDEIIIDNHDPRASGSGQIAKLSLHRMDGKVFFVEKPGAGLSYRKFLHHESPSDLILAYTASEEVEGGAGEALSLTLNIRESIFLDLCEAQYTVLFLAALDNVMENYLSTESSVDDDSSVSTPYRVFLNVDCVEFSLFRGSINVRENKLFKAYAVGLSLSYSTSSSGLDSTALTIDKLKVVDHRTTVYAAEKYIIDRKPVQAVSGKRGEDVMFYLTYNKPRNQPGSLEVQLAEARLLVVPPLLYELMRLTKIGDKFLETTENPRTYPFDGIKLSAHCRDDAICVSSRRNEAEREALVAVGDYFVSATVEPDNSVSALIAKFDLKGISASYNIYASDANVELVSPFNVAVELKEESICADVAGLRGKVDVRDMPLLTGCLVNISGLLGEDTGEEIEQQKDEKKFAKSVAVVMRDMRVIATEVFQGECIPFLDIRSNSCEVIGIYKDSRLLASADTSISMFDRSNNRWIPFVEQWSFSVEFLIPTPSNVSVSFTSAQLLNMNVSPSILNVLKAMKGAYQRTNEIFKAGAISGRDLIAWLKRPSIASYILKNESGLCVQISLVQLTDRKIRWSERVEPGADVEVHSRSSESNWDDLFTDTEVIKNSVKWEVAVEGYNPILFPSEDGARQAAVLRRVQSQYEELAQDSEILFLWEVTTQSGVLTATIKSDLIVTNEFGIPIEVKIGNSNEEEVLQINFQKSASIPCTSTTQSIYFRPAVHESLGMKDYQWTVGVCKENFTGRVGSRVSRLPLFVQELGSSEHGVFMHIDAKVQVSNSVEITIRPPLVLENRLPRSFLYGFVHSTDGLLAGGSIVATQTINLYTLRDELSGVKLMITYDNSTTGFQDQTFSMEIASGLSASGLLESSFEDSKGRRLLIFSRVWIENRCDLRIGLKGDLRMRDSILPSNLLGSNDPNVILLNSPKPTLVIPDGRIQRTWSVPVDAEEMNKPLEIPAASSSLLLFSRPSRWYERTTELVIMNSMWIQNRTGYGFQYQSTQITSQGFVASGDTVPMKLGPNRKATSIAIRLADGEWEWSYPISINPIGELPVLIQQSEFPEVYIARLSISKTSWGARVVVIKGEDFEHPPFVIHNACTARQVLTFRQRGTNAAAKCTIRSGEHVRYAWEIPDKKDNRKLLLAVNDIGNGDSGATEIDIQTPKKVQLFTRQRREFEVTVRSQGTTMLVEVYEKERSNVRELQLGEATESTVIPVVDWDASPSVDDASDPASGSRVKERNTLEEHVGTNARDFDQLLKDSPAALGPEAQMELSTKKHISVNVSLLALGISVISEEPQELLYISIAEPRLSFARDLKEEIVIATIGILQIDNQLGQAKWPVMLCFPAPHRSEKERPKRVIQLTTKRTLAAQEDILHFQGVHASVQAFDFRADESIALQLFKFYEDVQSSFQSSADIDSVETEIINAANVTRLQVQRFFISPVEMNISFTTSRSVRLAGVFDTIDHMASLIGKYYSKSFAKQRLRFASSSKLLGNPLKLFESVSAEAQHQFFPPADGPDSEDFLLKIGDVSGAFTKGMLESFAGFTESVSKGVGEFTDDEFYRQRELILRGDNEQVLPTSGFYRGAMTLGHGLNSGITGLLSDPYQGAIAGGAAGFADGLRRGITGAITKPIVGGMDFVSQPVAGYLNLISAPERMGKAQVVPVRPARTFDHQGHIRPYQWRRAIGHALYSYVARDYPRSSRFVGWLELTHEAGSEDGVYLARLWKEIASFVFFGTNPLLSNAAKGVLFRKRLAIVLSEHMMFITFSGEKLWTCPLADITSILEVDFDEMKLLLRVTSNPTLSAEVSCGSHEGKQKLLSMLSTVQPRLVPSMSPYSIGRPERLSSADDPPSPVLELSLQIVIVNESPKQFQLVREGLNRGNWTSSPPQVLPPWDAVTFEAANSGRLVGTIEFVESSTSAVMALSFSNMYPDDSRHGTIMPEDVKWTVDQVEGENSLLTIMISESHDSIAHRVEALDRLKAMGFEESMAREALDKTDGDVTAAIELLTLTDQ